MERDERVVEENVVDVDGCGGEYRGIVVGDEV